MTYDQLNLGGCHIFKNNFISKNKLISQLKDVKGITVNTIHGNDISISKVIELYDPTIESMEGASFFAACDNNINNYLQIRAISNYVEKRDKSKWQMPLAIKNLNELYEYLAYRLKKPMCQIYYYDSVKEAKSICFPSILLTLKLCMLWALLNVAMATKNKVARNFIKFFL